MLQVFKGVKTIETILGQFTKSMKELEEVAQFHADQAASKETRANQLTEEANGIALEGLLAKQESERAYKAAGALNRFYKGLIGESVERGETGYQLT